jgi:hypothetical protein
MAKQLNNQENSQKGGMDMAKNQKTVDSDLDEDADIVETDDYQAPADNN